MTDDIHLVDEPTVRCYLCGKRIPESKAIRQNLPTLHDGWRDRWINRYLMVDLCSICSEQEKAKNASFQRNCDVLVACLVAIPVGILLIASIVLMAIRVAAYFPF